EGDTVLGERVTFTLQPQIAFTVMDQSTGQVVAMVGGRGEKTASRTLNRATQSPRQPGSTFKIVSTYAPALDTQEFTLATVVDNAPFSYESGDAVTNHNGRYTGWTDLRYAITDSTNIVAVKTLTEISVQTGMDYLEKFGFTTITQNDFGQPLSLGGLYTGVYNDELTAAFAAIANGGVYNEPILYTKIIDHDGNVLIENVPETRKVIEPTTAFLLTDAMQDVITSGTGGAAYFPGMSIAGKTGTTTDDWDTLFAGFSPYYTCVVWGGYDSPSDVGSTRFTRVIWKNVMQQIHEGLEDPGFTRPDGLTRVTVCSKTGLLPVEDLCDDTHTEYFIKGTTPNKRCDQHEKVKICKDSLLLATEYCPVESVEEKVLLKNANPSTEDKELVIPEESCAVHNELTYQQQIQDQLQQQLQNQLQQNQQQPTQTPTTTP
ncbi:MAG: glycosyl transferase, partial [Eubacterium sp.]|nr:glycosyl transferase [Eubacterium sp.]